MLTWFVFHVLWCIVAVCKPQCENGGSCILPNYCMCPRNTYGASCERCQYITLIHVMPYYVMPLNMFHVQTVSPLPQYSQLYYGLYESIIE